MAESVVDAVHRAYYDEELRARADRPLTEGRRRRVEEFAARCGREGLRSVVEVGCGAGRDGLVLAEAGLAYTGVDLSAVGVEVCRAAGLGAQVASATALPFAADSFDAGWTMSTLMHLDGDGMSLALAELGRVVRPGGVLEIGVWGRDEDGEWVDRHGRYFRHRPDDDLRGLLGEIGVVDAFEATDFGLFGAGEENVHYQWARVRIA
ncbi:Methyltransferase domain-containing protein [Nocardioides sp. YR527]|uniref:class I SAM-dependent methyltransferase n=1 Tax=Nocardioides sp. YR527 TaxID=1881028 RepID=UPI00089110BF|nr:class I SAM-dependent methyltransferase [Nocardioides sp. YR527]SDK33861.1 Methyltransferase domain-containing protein [Nocardioides sp. YR527]